ncbi:MAG: transglutaminase family protein [Methanobrevibacter sp.]|jgi:hypothetical protein|nr:transglutaminase family protein [Candidatus Methanoflexus mossambicus]
MIKIRKNEILLMSIFCVFLLFVNVSFAAEENTKVDVKNNSALMDANIVSADNKNIGKTADTGKIASYLKYIKTNINSIDFNNVIKSEEYKTFSKTQEFKNFANSKDGKAILNPKGYKSFLKLNGKDKVTAINNVIISWNKFQKNNGIKVINFNNAVTSVELTQDKVVGNVVDNNVDKAVNNAVGIRNDKYFALTLKLLNTKKYNETIEYLLSNPKQINSLLINKESVKYLKSHKYYNYVLYLKKYHNGINKNLKSIDYYLNHAAAGEVAPKTLSQSFIVSISKRMLSYMNKYDQLPPYIPLDNYVLSATEMTYLLSKTIVNKYNGVTSNVAVIYDFKNPTSPQGSSVSATLDSKSYVSVANTVATYLSSHKSVPGYLVYDGIKVKYQTVFYFFTKVLANTDSNGKLPAKVSISVSANNPLNSYMPNENVYGSFSGISTSKLIDVYKPISLTSYKTNTSNAQSKDQDIMNLALYITKNTKNELEKAKAIFNYVNDKLDYSFYYNTKYGAKKALSNGVANCVDSSHALVALSRAAGLAARYVHGICTFSSGTYGHVWTQILVGNYWVVADASNDRNSFGVVNNWNPNSYTLHGKYAQITF